MAVRPGEVTGLLRAWCGGDLSALDRLVPLVHTELRRLARRYMAGERPGHVLQTTALVNEAYLRLVDASDVPWQSRAHFFAIAAQLMRRVLVDHARSRRAAKRGGGVVHIELDPSLTAPERAPDLEALDDALAILATVDPRKARVIELRFFGGLSVPETAEVLALSEDSVARDWRLGKAWLLRELSGGSR